MTATQKEQPKAEFIPIEADGVEARMNDRVLKMTDDGKVAATYEVILTRPSQVIIRVVGAFKAGTEQKVSVPKVFNANGIKVGETLYKLQIKKGTEPKKAGAKRPAPKKRGEGPTKMDKCREIWKNNPNLAKVDMVAKFIAEAGCTPMGANTYYLTLKNKG